MSERETKRIEAARHGAGVSVTVTQQATLSTRYEVLVTEGTDSVRLTAGRSFDGAFSRGVEIELRAAEAEHLGRLLQSAASKLRAKAAADA